MVGENNKGNGATDQNSDLNADTIGIGEGSFLFNSAK